MDNKTKHLEMIQGIVNRLAHCSFLLKGWSVIIVSALFALAAKDSKAYFIYLAYLPAIAFWGLDGYYLWQERLFRALYDRVREMSDSDIDFSMDTAPIKNQVAPWISVVFSRTILAFHGAIVATITIVTLIITYIK
jgi:hypothetical protein